MLIIRNISLKLPLPPKTLAETVNTLAANAVEIKYSKKLDINVEYTISPNVYFPVKSEPIKLIKLLANIPKIPTIIK